MANLRDAEGQNPDQANRDGGVSERLQSGAREFSKAFGGVDFSFVMAMRGEDGMVSRFGFIEAEDNEGMEVLRDLTLGMSLGVADLYNENAG